MSAPKELSRLYRPWTIFILLGAWFTLSDSTCTFPGFLTGTWFNSDLGELTFNSSKISTIYSVSSFGPQTLTCTEKSGNRYLVVSDAFTYLGVSLQTGFCWDMTTLSSTGKIVYYTALPVLANTTNDRLLLKVSGYSFSIINDCEFSSSYDVRQVGVMIKNGSINSVKTTCPDSLLGTFNYTFDTGSGNQCTGNSALDVCSDNSELTYNYSACAITQGYSREGQLTCVYDQTSGNDVYVIAYNTDSTSPDRTSYFKFTCFAISSTTNYSYTYMTQYPSGCYHDQTSTSVSSEGASLVLYASVPVPSDDTDNVLSAGSIVAIVLVSFIILLAVTLAIAVWCHKKWKAKHVTPAIEPIKSPPMNTFDRVGSAFSRDGMITSYSPYPTVSEMATYRFGPSPIQDDDGGITLCTTTAGITDGERVTLAPTTPGINDDYMDVNEDEQSGPYPNVNDENQELEPELNQLPETEKDADQVSLPVYSEVGGETPEPTRLTEIDEENLLEELNKNPTNA